jgi:hypothetical protein
MDKTDALSAIEPFPTADVPVNFTLLFVVPVPVTGLVKVDVVPSAIRYCVAVPPLFTSVVAFNVPMIVAALPVPDVLFKYKPSPLPPFDMFNAIPLPLEWVMLKVLSPPDDVNAPVVPIRPPVSVPPDNGRYKPNADDFA